MTAPGEGRVSPLERRGRLLLRMYPAGYRRERGEEMIGTLLETTPDGRTWPQLRDVRALAAGGLQTRAAQNRRLSTAANLRIAVMAGVSLYLVLVAAEHLRQWVIGPRLLAYAWPDIAVGLLVATATLVAWIAPRAVAVVICLAAAGAVYFVGRQHVAPWPLIWLTVCVAGIALLAPHAGRSPRKWLWFIGTFAAAVVWVMVAARHGWPGTLQVLPLLAFAVVSLAWLAVDAKLAVAVASFVLTFYGEEAALFSAYYAVMLPVVLTTAAIGALAVWVLRRQSAPRARSS